MQFGNDPFLFKKFPEKVLIRTSRLHLRPIRIEDVLSIFTCFTHNVAKYMTPKPADDISETQKFVKTAVQAFKEQRDLELVIEMNSEFFGLTGLHSRKGPMTPEIGPWLKEEAWGRGYGFESVLGLIDWTREHLEFDEFVYPVDKRNQRSRKIPLKLGAKLVSQYKGARGRSEDLEIEEYRFS